VSKESDGKKLEKSQLCNITFYVQQKCFKLP